MDPSWQKGAVSPQIHDQLEKPGGPFEAGPRRAAPSDLLEGRDFLDHASMIQADRSRRGQVLALVVRRGDGRAGARGRQRSSKAAVWEPVRPPPAQRDDTRWMNREFSP